ncbi:hypothetical protein GCM10023094_17770 [Rhodococcus olei]|uniref:Uncharacterized protein n=1 Tax=Rhodococcus olei TaxID=2161675 RepID=A0ABP8P0F4_9NOCA
MAPNRPILGPVVVGAEGPRRVADGPTGRRPPIVERPTDERAIGYRFGPRGRGLCPVLANSCNFVINRAHC